VAGKLAPSYGPHSGGTKVSITGNGFTGASGVNFGATPATDFKIENDGLVTVNSPPAPPKDSEAKVYVVFSSTSPPNTEVWTFYYYTISPSHGPAVGGQVVTIIGSGLKDVSAVKFGDKDGINLQPLTLDPGGRESRAVEAPGANPGSDVPVKLVFPVESVSKISVIGTYHYD
jgi:IPT/TIG domain